MNWCIGSILAAAATASVSPISWRLLRVVLVHLHDVQARAGESREHQPQHDPRRGAEKFVEQKADHDPAERIADHRREHLRADRADHRCMLLRYALVLG